MSFLAAFKLYIGYDPWNCLRFLWFGGYFLFLGIATVISIIMSLIQHIAWLAAIPATISLTLAVILPLINKLTEIEGQEKKKAEEEESLIQKENQTIDLYITQICNFAEDIACNSNMMVRKYIFQAEAIQPDDNPRYRERWGFDIDSARMVADMNIPTIIKTIESKSILGYAEVEVLANALFQMWLRAHNKPYNIKNKTLPNNIRKQILDGKSGIITMVDATISRFLTKV
jgi:hypothetical protein